MAYMNMEMMQYFLKWIHVLYTITIQLTSKVYSVCLAIKKYKRSSVCIHFPAIVPETLLNSVKNYSNQLNNIPEDLKSSAC
jgi:hypothetical protein